jgi:hypothetical protein
MMMMLTTPTDVGVDPLYKHTQHVQCIGMVRIQQKRNTCVKQENVFVVRVQEADLIRYHQLIGLVVHTLLRHHHQLKCVHALLQYNHSH